MHIFQSKRRGITEKWLQKRDVTLGSLRSTKRRQRQRHKFYILNEQKQKLCTPFTCLFFISVHFLPAFTANLRREMAISQVLQRT